MRASRSRSPPGWGGRGLLLGLPASCSHRHDVHVGKLRGAGVRRSLLVFGVLLVHSLPEGFAIGTAFASDTEGLALFVFLAIALQNVPEGTSVAIPMAGRRVQPLPSSSGPRCSRARRNPLGAVLAYIAVEQVSGLLTVLVRLRGRSDAGAGRDRAHARRPACAEGGAAALAGALLGAGLMLALAATLGVET